MFSPLFIHIKLEGKTYKTLVLYKMSYLENLFKGTVITREFADEGLPSRGFEI